MKKLSAAVILMIVAFAACKDKEKSTEDNTNNNAVKPPAKMEYGVIKAFPHDTSSFTEGLFWLNEQLYESTGLQEKSYLLRADLATGKANKKIKLPSQFFGEGIAMINNKIYQLTYQEHKVFVYDMEFKKIGEFDWPYEGWGITTDGKQLIMDTGGSNLYFINPETFKIERTLGVYNNNGYVDSINELEYVDGYIYANRWLTDLIVKINPKTGLVEAQADMSEIFRRSNLPGPANPGACLNGIAYDNAKKSFYITGKYWPYVFEVKFN